MLWHSPKRKDRDTPSDLTVGQRFDLVDTAIEIASRGMGGGKNPLNWMTGTMAVADITFSSSTAKNGNAVGAGASALAAQATGMAVYVAAMSIGAEIGSFILPFAGTAIG